MPRLTNETTEKLIRRVKQLTQSSTPKWGKMNVNQMLAHCSSAIKMAFSDYPAEVKFGPVKAALARLAFIDLLPFPKGKLPTAAEMDPAKKLVVRDQFEAEQNDLILQLQRINSTPDNFNFGPHPIFRKMSRKRWGQLLYKHIDHHLRQFGV